jgi:tetratricopeptide (TPR) repeat protein
MPGRGLIQHYVVPFLLLLTVAVALYWPTLNYPFLFDDAPNITENRHIRVTSLSWDSLYTAATKSFASQRPVANLTLALNYYFGGYEPFGYRLFNIVIHGLTACFIFTFARLTMILALRKEPDRSKTTGTAPHPITLLAFVTAMIWLVHPLQTQSVTYVVQRMNSMAVCFYMGALCIYIIGRQRKSITAQTVWLIVAVLTWMVAMGSKQIAFTWPFVVALYEWYFFRGLSGKWIRKHLTYGIPAALCLGSLAFLFTSVGNILKVYEGRPFSLSERLLTESRVVMHYISEVFVPHPSRLNLDYDFALSTSFVSPATTLLSILAIVALLVVAGVIARQRPVLSFCVLWLFIHLMIESTVMPLEIAFEHRMYLPSIGVILAVIWTIYRNQKLRHPGMFAVAAAVIVLFGWWTYERNQVWSTELTLWEDCARKSPKKARTRNNLGMAQARAKQYDDAIETLEIAITLDRNYPNSYTNLGTTYAKLDRHAEAIKQYRIALKLTPDNANTLANLADSLKKTDKPKASIAAFEKAIAKNPYHIDAHLGLGNLKSELGDYDGARALFEKALATSPGNPKLYNNIGIVHARQKKFDLAAEAFSKALVALPDSAETLCNLGNAHRDLGDPSRGLQFYAKALAADKRYVKAMVNSGRIQLAARKPAEAETWFRQTIAVQPGHVGAQRHLDQALEMQGKSGDVVARSLAALAENPNDVETHLRLGNFYFERNNLSEAAKYYEAIVRIDPKLAVGHFNLSAVAIRSDDAATAREHLRKTLEIDATHEMARQRFVNTTHALVVPLLNGTELVRAESICRDALEVVPDSAVIYNALGAAVGQQGRIQEAISAFETAVRLNPENKDARTNLEAIRGRQP